MDIHGIITAMVTPFDAHGEISVAGTKQLIEQLIDKGVSGIFILGTNGEFQHLHDDEKVEFAKLVVQSVNKRVPVYAGAGACGTKLAIDLAKQMKEVGVDALSIIAPYFQVLSDAEMIDHYQSIADAVDLPILLYNIPSITQNPISVNVVKALCNHPNIVGIKDSGGNIEIMERYIHETKDADFVVLAGSDSLILKALQLGAVGAVAATSNYLTKIDVAIYDCFKQGKIDEAQRYQQDLETLRASLKLKRQPSVLKRTLQLSGIPVGNTRKPLQAPTAEDDVLIKQMMQYYEGKL